MEAGDYLLDEMDPFSLWFAGQAPTSPVSESTHGILRSPMQDGQEGLERVQCGGVCRAWVNVTDADHHFCDAAVDEHVLQSNAVGPHKIVYKPSGTGELDCVVLLYAADTDYLIAEAILAEDLCPTDSGGAGTGSEGQTVLVSNAKLMPSCREFTPDRVVNDKNHAGPAGSIVSMYRRFCDSGVEEWVIFDVELRPYCSVAGVEDRTSCVVGWGLRTMQEWCPEWQPTDVCVIYSKIDCEQELPACDTTLVWDPLYACCLDDVWGSGTGSGT